MKRFLSIWWTWLVRKLLVTVNQFAVHYDRLGREIFKLLMHGWRRRDGGTSKRHGCGLLMHANVAPRSGEVAKWLLPIHPLEIKVCIDLMLPCMIQSAFDVLVMQLQNSFEWPEMLKCLLFPTKLILKVSNLCVTKVFHLDFFSLSVENCRWLQLVLVT